jgi:DNA (cytosine-5)-methyltransferase 1
MNFIDLFAGAGGLSEGFIRAGFEPIAHVEMDEAASYTLKTRQTFHYLKNSGKELFYENYLRGDITRSQLYSLIPPEELSRVMNLAIGDQNNSMIFNKIDAIIGNGEVDLIVGGPPCQAYSLVGRARDKNGMKNDPRNHLYLQYAKYLKKYNPKMFVFENVVGLLSANKGIFFKNMQAYFRRIGYNVEAFKIDAKNFGVLQNRRRIIIIGWKKELSGSIPDLERHRTLSQFKVMDLFGDLIELNAGEGKDKYNNYSREKNDCLRSTSIRNGSEIFTQHVARPHTEQDKEIYRIAIDKWNLKKERLSYADLPKRLKTHNNQHSFLDRFKVVGADEPSSQTIVAHIAKDGHYYIHPDIKQNRSISVREAARIQSFPDDYYFEGVKENSNRTAAFKQIGNAVPPLMAEVIAKKIACIFQ